jgi:drug/metabolite transporter (DMT)-like permease
MIIEFLYMTGLNFAKLMILGAIWGASFLLMRISVTDLGPTYLIAIRCLLGAAFLGFIGFIVKSSLNWKSNWRHYMILGLVNTAVPFFLFGIASQFTSASVLSILNSTAALWAAIITAIWTKTLPSVSVIFGLIAGLVGVVILVGIDPRMVEGSFGLGVLAGLCAAFCYGLASVYSRYAAPVDAQATAQGSLWASVAFLLPVMLVSNAPIAVSPKALAGVILLGVVCSGLAYRLYFDLIKDIGAAQAVSVAFLIPVFGVTWGAVFLNEPIKLNMILGGALILVAIVLITDFDARKLLERQKPSVT